MREQNQAAEGGTQEQQPAAQEANDLPAPDATAQAVHEQFMAAGGEQSQGTAEEQKAAALDTLTLDESRLADEQPLPSMDHEVAAGRVVETTQPGDTNRTFAPAPSAQGDGDPGLQAAQEPLSQASLRGVDGPTLEVFVAAGYLIEAYPPAGYAEIPSAALTRYRETGEGPTEAELSEARAALESEAEAAGEQLPGPAPAGAEAGLSAEDQARLRRAGPKTRRQWAASQG